MKLRYALSSATTLTASFLGSQTYADQNGNNSKPDDDACSRRAAGTPARCAAGTQTIVDPDNFGFPAYEINNEPIFQAELRTSLGATRPRALLRRIDQPPAVRFQPDLNASSSFKRAHLRWRRRDGNPVFNGLDQYGNPYTVTIPGPNDPVLERGDARTANGGALGGGNNYYDSAEEDRLAGTSFEYDHFLGDTGNVVSFAYDTNHARTHSYRRSKHGQRTGRIDAEHDDVSAARHLLTSAS